MFFGLKNGEDTERPSELFDSGYTKIKNKVQKKQTTNKKDLTNSVLLPSCNSMLQFTLYRMATFHSSILCTGCALPTFYWVDIPMGLVNIYLATPARRWRVFQLITVQWTVCLKIVNLTVRTKRATVIPLLSDTIINQCSQTKHRCLLHISWLRNECLIIYFIRANIDKYLQIYHLRIWYVM